MPDIRTRMLRRIGYAIALGMMITAAHIWNSDRVFLPILFLYDLMILLLILFVFAVLMDGASERRKNVNVFVLLGGGVLSLLFVMQAC